MMLSAAQRCGLRRLSTAIEAGLYRARPRGGLIGHDPGAPVIAMRRALPQRPMPRADYKIRCTKHVVRYRSITIFPGTDYGSDHSLLSGRERPPTRSSSLNSL